MSKSIFEEEWCIKWLKDRDKADATWNRLMKRQWNSKNKRDFNEEAHEAAAYGDDIGMSIGDFQ